MARILLLVLLVIVMAMAAVAGVSAVAAHARETPPTPPEVAASPRAEAAVVLGGWDAARSHAWTDGRPGELRSLYTRGSVAGRHDRAMVRSWARRGLVVQGLRTQLLAVRELSRTPCRWTLEVTDRIAGGIAVGRGIRIPLPVDSATTRRIQLRLVDGTWRVASVIALRSAG